MEIHSNTPESVVYSLVAFQPSDGTSIFQFISHHAFIAFTSLLSTVELCRMLYHANETMVKIDHIPQNDYKYTSQFLVGIF